MNRLAGLALLGLSLLATPLSAGDGPPVQPVSNPLYAESAVPQSRLSLSYAWQNLPDQIRTNAGKIDLDGDASMLNLGVEYAFAENWSLLLNKSGYIWLDSDAGDDESGLADLSVGVKWRFFREGNVHVAARLTTEWPTGDDNVLQGNGDGAFSPALLASYAGDRVTINSLLGLILPIDRDEESSSSYASLGVGYHLTDSLILHGELNWFRVISEGDGSADFDARGFDTASNPNGGGNGGGGDDDDDNPPPQRPVSNDELAESLPFEGGDYFNLGAADAESNRNLVTGAVGVSYLLTQKISLGVSYEKSLTAEERGLLDDRVNLSATLSF